MTFVSWAGGGPGLETGLSLLRKDTGKARPRYPGEKDFFSRQKRPRSHSPESHPLGRTSFSISAFFKIPRRGHA